MKKLIFLALLITSPLYGHLIQIDDKELLSFTDGDADTAYKIQQTCKISRLSKEDCHKTVGLGVKDPDQSKAALKCTAARYAPLIKIASSSGEPEGSRGHLLPGGVPHAETMCTGGELGCHFYTSSPEVKEAAINTYIAKYVAEKVALRNAQKDVVTSSKGSLKSAELGVSSGIEGKADGAVAEIGGTLGLDGKGSLTSTQDTSKQLAPFTPEEIKALENQAAQIAYSDPTVAGYSLSTICSDKFEFCLGTSSTKMRSPLWKGAITKSESKPVDKKESRTETGTKAPVGVPKTSSAEAEPSAVVIGHVDAGMWADNDRNESGDGTMIARAVDNDTTTAVKTTFQKCIEAEKKKIKDFRGSTTVDPKQETLEEKKARAEEQLKAGFCDESYLGRAFCQDFRNKRAIVEDQLALSENEVVRESALIHFKKTGICNPAALGQAFCRAERDKLNRTPVGAGAGFEKEEPRVFKPGAAGGVVPPIIVKPDRHLRSPIN